YGFISVVKVSYPPENNGNFNIVLYFFSNGLCGGPIIKR
ncbi:unnamed protein product, partial [Rotaria sp. Silwood2]